MTKHNQLESRDEVLFAFQQACERPTAEQIIDWTARFPQFADDIRAHAAIARDWAASEGLPVEAPDESTLSRGFSRVLNALYNAQTASTSANSSLSAQSFQQMMLNCGTDVPTLARELGIARSVLADMCNGGMLPPVGRPLVNALVAKMAITPDFIDGALHQALASPHVGHAKAQGAPVVIPRKYEDIVRDSGMSAERIKFWLGEGE